MRSSAWSHEILVNSPLPFGPSRRIRYHSRPGERVYCR
jgi:hypothetical protein